MCQTESCISTNYVIRGFRTPKPVDGPVTDFMVAKTPPTSRILFFGHCRTHHERSARSKSLALTAITPHNEQRTRTHNPQPRHCTWISPPAAPPPMRPSCTSSTPPGWRRCHSATVAKKPTSISMMRARSADPPRRAQGSKIDNLPIYQLLIHYLHQKCIPKDSSHK